MSAPTPRTNDDESNVCVAIKIRPLVSSELDDGCRESLFVTPGVPQVSTGQHTFTYDHVFGEGGSGDAHLYPKCVAPLVEGLFRGYNACVLAYGQTGSGKTYTMGSEYRPGGRCRGVIPDAINDIFARIEAAKDSSITVRISFVEIHKEEIKDLLLPNSNGPRAAITIRDTPSGGVALYGASEKEVRTREEMADALETGTLCRSTASTNMNNRSSRSHAIFSITIEQRRQVQQNSMLTPNSEVATTPGGDEDDEGDEDGAGDDGEGMGCEDYLCAKMHLVDLAGSERAKRTKAEGARLREGIHINRGLLALGNVINAIVDNHKHVPYRDSKLTRLLQDSLGGNSRTVMLACVSPADSNFEESLNTLRYADRARHIRNKPVVNRDPVAAQLAVLRNQIAQLRSENMALKRAVSAAGGEGGLAAALGGSNDAVVDQLQQENTSLEADNLRLKMLMDELREELARASERWQNAEAQCVLLRHNQARASRAAAGLLNAGADGQDGFEMCSPGQQDRAAAGSEEAPLPGFDIVLGYIQKVASLESELEKMKSLARMSFARRVGMTVGNSTPGTGLRSPFMGVSSSPLPLHGADLDDDGEQPELGDDQELMAAAVTHNMDQEGLQKTQKALQQKLDDKHRKLLALKADAAAIGVTHDRREHYERVIAQVQAERDKLQLEKKQLREKLAAISAANDEERKRLEANYRSRLEQADEQLKALRRKEREFINAMKLKQRADEMHRNLLSDIQRIKQQKAAIQRQLEANAKDYQSKRLEREKELAQLRRQGNKDALTIQTLREMQAKQNQILQRKTADAAAARKRIKELEETRRTLRTTSADHPNVAQPPRSDAERREWLLKELGVCNMSCEFRTIIEGELALRAEASRKLKETEKKLASSDQPNPNSPFPAGGAVGYGLLALPLSPVHTGTPGGVSAETRGVLLNQKKELEEKVAYHNTQINEMQARWERQKAEEEQRGGGASDSRRWTGLSSVVECRELLRTLFKISVESKCLNNDLTLEVQRLSEDNDVHRVQLEAAAKKVAQYRKLAAAYQAAALAHVTAAPQHSVLPAEDETDKQVDAVIEELRMVKAKTPSATSLSGRASATSGRTNTAGGTELSGAAALGVAAAADVEMMDVDGGANADNGGHSPASPTAHGTGIGMLPKALEFLSPVPSDMRPHVSMNATSGTAQRYTSHNDSDDEEDADTTEDESDDEDDVVSEAEGQNTDDMDVDGAIAPEEDTFDDDEDDEADEDWDPTNRTPARKGRVGGRNSRRSSAVLVGGAVRRNSRRHSRDDEAEAADTRRRSSGLEAGPATEGGNSRRGSASSVPDETLKRWEADLLNVINMDRISFGKPRVAKLTVALLKDTLKGKEINGQRWCAGSKTRAQLIKDAAIILLDVRPEELEPVLSEQLQAPMHGVRLPVASGDLDSESLLRRGSNRLRQSQGDGICVLRAGSAATLNAIAANKDFSFTPQHRGNNAPLVAASPLATPSARRTQGPSMGPWARASLTAAQVAASRHPTNWASSLRSSCNLPAGSAPAAEGSNLGPSGSASRLGTTPAPAVPVHQRRSSAGSPSTQAGGYEDCANGSQLARPLHAWISMPVRRDTQQPGAAAGGSVGNSMDFRSAVLSPPQKSSSPRAPLHIAPGANSPRNSMGTPTMQQAQQPRRAASAKPSPSSAGGAWSVSPVARASRDRQPSYGENVTPGAHASAFGGVKATSPLANLYLEKAAKARERSTALKRDLERDNSKKALPHSDELDGIAVVGVSDKMRASEAVPSLSALVTAASSNGALVTSSLDAIRLANARENGSKKAIWR